MARKSRVSAETAAKELTAKESADRVWSTALYVRLSVLDGGKTSGVKTAGKQSGCETVKIQEAVLRNFIEGKSCFSLAAVYVDNGRSGVNFNRGEFERLMEDVKKGFVDCIIVKDLSRLGRNYIETGEYLERIFPLMGVRVIAVNDCYDSSDPNSFDKLSIHLKNLVNDIYARDISRKLCPVLRTKQERGEFIGSFAPYGYQKSEKDKHRLVLDPETAPVVRAIFCWRLKGCSCGEIVGKLRERGILSPGRYRYENGMTGDESLRTAEWKASTVSRILSEPVYLGHMVQGKRRTVLWEGKRQERVPREQWIRVENTHEPIVEEALFYAVQK